MKQNPSRVCGEGAASSTGAAGGAAASGEGAAASTGAAAGALAFSVGTLPRRRSNWSAWQRWLHDGVAKRMGIPVYP